MGFYTNEPTLLAAQKFPIHVWLFDDFGYALVEEVYIARSSDVAHNKAELVRIITAEAQGWQRPVRDPGLGARLATNRYGRDLHLVLSEQTKAAVAQNKLVVTADTRAHGLF